MLLAVWQKECTTGRREQFWLAISMFGLLLYIELCFKTIKKVEKIIQSVAVQKNKIV